MNDKTITALAREYAEFTDMSLVDKKNISAICECFLKYTLRRYCLVEKSKAITAYKAMSNYGKEKGVECAQCANYAARVWMKHLFPDLTKEVQEPKTNHRSHENSWCENEL